MAITEIKAPAQVRFEKPGECVEGVLHTITPHTVKGKKTIQYTVVKRDGNKVTFLGTWDLVQKIDRTMLGYPLSVKFEKLHDSIERNGNRAKVFTVMADWDAKPAAHADADSLEITDEDFPF
jgi:hypothetical protein